MSIELETLRSRVRCVTAKLTSCAALSNFPLQHFQRCILTAILQSRFEKNLKKKFC